MRIQRLSWAGIKLEIEDTTILIDATARNEDGDLEVDVVTSNVNGARQITEFYTDSSFPMVLTPEQAATAATLLRAEQTCPIHYGGHTPPSYLEKPDSEYRFLQAAKERNLNVKLMKAGEWLEV
ncbi:MAG: hypothetical protein ACRCYY_00600 [Trueperaceae bacterium]